MSRTKTEDLAGMTLPCIHIIADTLPEAWEKAVIAVWEDGCKIPTAYDKPDDPPSRDCSLVLSVKYPFAEPRIHLAIPGGIRELEIYKQEVCDGIHDHWIDPANGKWEYTYHERLRRYDVPGVEQAFDQIQYMIDCLVDLPYTRRAQGVTWQTWNDAGIADPPCLQRIWVRIIGDRLVMNVHMRSNDAYKAAFMNMYAFTEWQRYIAEQVSEKLGEEILVGQYNHWVDSFHIYGSYEEEFKRFLQSLKLRTWKERTWCSDDPDVLEQFKEVRDGMQAMLAAEDAKTPIRL